MPAPVDKRERIAFFGGSFDPPHMGHIGIARAAQRALELDTVLFAPVGIQPLKPHGSSAGYQDRVAMTKLAIEREPNFAVSLADAPNPNGTPNYTIDTLVELKRQFPTANLFTLMGADSLLSLPHWHRAAEVPFLAPLIVASRPGERLEDLAATLPAGLTIHEDGPVAPGESEYPIRVLTLRSRSGNSTPLYLLQWLAIEISASEVRKHVRRALDSPCQGPEIVPEAVCAYISAHDLYQ
jgi:nicotinate-nucleotide adenylyltransferase